MGASLVDVALKVDLSSSDHAAMTARGHSACRHEERAVGIFVNQFTTDMAKSHELVRVRCVAKGGQRVPSRTIRRVHVMPWATPVRRIGLTRQSGLSPEDGDLADSI